MLEQAVMHGRSYSSSMRVNSPAKQAVLVYLATTTKKAMDCHPSHYSPTLYFFNFMFIFVTFFTRDTDFSVTGEATGLLLRGGGGQNGWALKNRPKFP